MTKALTGRLLVLLSDRSARMSVAALRRAAGPQIATTLDVRSGHLSPEETEGADAVYFDKLGVALVNVDPRDAKRTARIRTAAVENEARIFAVEPERYVHAYATRKPPAGSERTDTWGLQATGVPASKFSGKGVKVAVLDTGFDLRHPDFPGRSVTAVSFVKGYKAQDGHGHGTHCIGTSCGPRGWPPRREVQ
jgi:subtilisin family serine protease